MPPAARIVRWVRGALGDGAGAARAQITVRFVSRTEAAELNRRYRARDYAPNVLSFRYAERGAIVGDIVVCPAIVALEARAHDMSFESRLAHLVVHGILHLRGFDHASALDAQRMERLESRVVTALGHNDPWAGERAAHETMKTGNTSVPV
ncbi:MAG: rRNA maturation RNase YbeY [Proteobacteria bacterium]|nr:rRNA maturation RNase YbeY [Burkholderiales bacterium]